MSGSDLRKLVKKSPFTPIEIVTSDGRTVLVRHPDQVMIARRNVVFGIAQVRRTKGDLSTPDNGDDIAKDWLMVDLLHIVSAEPAGDRKRNANSTKPRPRKQ